MMAQADHQWTEICHGQVEWWVLPSGNLNTAMENHHVQWENSLFLWPFSIAILNYQRVHGIASLGMAQHS